jgi:hypothetical protein
MTTPPVFPGFRRKIRKVDGRGQKVAIDSATKLPYSPHPSKNFRDLLSRIGMRNRIFSLLLLSSLGTACGCVQMYPTRSGFLSDYSTLTPVDRKGHVRIKPADTAALATIDSFYIEPVQWLADDLGQPASSEKRMLEMRNAFQASLTDELGKIHPVVDTIGPQTAVVRAAVTGIQESKPFANLFMAVQIAGPLFNGGAASEIEVLTADGRQITAESAGFRGHDWDFIGYFWRPNHARSALRKAVRMLAGEISGVSPVLGDMAKSPSTNSTVETDSYGASEAP